MKQMTPRDARFYGEYIKDGNGTRAAEAIGVPKEQAAVFATRTLKKKAVAKAVDDWKKRQLVKNEITAERVIQELVKLATYDPGNLYDADGNRIPVHLLDDVTRAAVASVEDETTESVTGEGDKATRKTTRNQKIKMAEKGQNLERLGRYFKLFTDRVEHDGRVTLEQLVTESWEDAASEQANS